MGSASQFLLLGTYVAQKTHVSSCQYGETSDSDRDVLPRGTSSGVRAVRLGGRQRGVEVSSNAEEARVSAARVTENIRKLIAERSGLIVPEHDFQVLRSYVDARMVATECADGHEYLELISEGARAGTEFTQLVKLVTVGHTRFFRNPRQLAALRDIVLPALVADHVASGSGEPLRILSAGCSTGEEPYSLAMLLLDEQKKGTCPGFEIIATDISPDSLAKARARTYSPDALKYVEPHFTERYMDRYCEVDEKELVVGLAAAGRVEFQQVNILDYEPPQPVDIIFCRNVTIYFSQETARAVLDRMHGWLAPNGYLFAGAAESPSQVSDRFRPVRIGRSFAYVTADSTSPAAASRDASTSVREAARVALKSTARRRSRPATRVTATTGQSGPSAEELRLEAERWLAVKEYETAERTVRRALEIDERDTGAQALLAQILANRGELDEAERVCRDVLMGDTLVPEAHFLMGCIHREMSQTDEALADFQRCVYLDGDNSLAYFAIAGIHREKGRDRDAQREYQNALLALGRCREQGENAGGAITCWMPRSRSAAPDDRRMEGQDAD